MIREKVFKLQLKCDDFEATLEGSYLHEPLNSLVIGRYKNGDEVSNFAL